jgi:hypothetical protein
VSLWLVCVDGNLIGQGKSPATGSRRIVLINRHTGRNLESKGANARLQISTHCEPLAAENDIEDIVVPVSEVHLETLTQVCGQFGKIALIGLRQN